MSFVKNQAYYLFLIDKESDLKKKKRHIRRL